MTSTMTEREVAAALAAKLDEYIRRYHTNGDVAKAPRSFGCVPILLSSPRGRLAARGGR